MEQRTKIGYLVGGGLKENFRVRLIVSPQEIQEGGVCGDSVGGVELLWHRHGYSARIDNHDKK